MKPNIAIFTEIDGETRNKIKGNFEIVFERTPETEKECMRTEVLARLLREKAVEVAVVEAHPITKAVMEEAKALKLVVSVRTTLLNVDLKASRERAIAVTRSPARNAVAVAELTIAQILNCARKIPFAYSALKNGEYLLPAGTEPNHASKDIIWAHPEITVKPYAAFRGREVSGTVLGIIGYGTIGRMVSDRATALGMRVRYFDPYVSGSGTGGAKKVDVLEELLADADFVTLHAKATPENDGMINERTLGLMKPTAYIINTARGALIRQADLAKALKNHVIAGAALDVFESEPLVLGEEILGLENVIYTPHIAGATTDVIRHHSESVWRNLEAYVTGAAFPDLVEAE